MKRPNDPEVLLEEKCGPATLLSCQYQQPFPSPIIKLKELGRGVITR